MERNCRNKFARIEEAYQAKKKNMQKRLELDGGIEEGGKER